MQLAGDSEFAVSVRALICGDALEAPNASDIGSRAASACQLLSQRLARLVGELGTRTMFDRSLHLASPAFTCLATFTVKTAPDAYEALRASLAQESATVALDAAVHVFVTFVGLLERFIGTPLVASLIHEAWPTIFPSVRKEIP